MRIRGDGVGGILRALDPKINADLCHYDIVEEAKLLHDFRIDCSKKFSLLHQLFSLI